MPIPQRCFTCGKSMQKKYVSEYIELLQKYSELMQNDPKQFIINDKVVDSNTNAIKEINIQLSPQFFALRDLGIWRECCRKMYIATHCIDDEIH